MIEHMGLAQTSELTRTVAVISAYKKLMQLQGELVVKLIESAAVMKPSDTLQTPGLGGRIDIHV